MCRCSREGRRGSEDSSQSPSVLGASRARCQATVAQPETCSKGSCARLRARPPEWNRGIAAAIGLMPPCFAELGAAGPRGRFQLPRSLSSGLQAGDGAFVWSLRGRCPRRASSSRSRSRASSELPKATGASLPKASGPWIAAAGEVSGTATGNTLIGHVAAAGSAATLVQVRLSN